ncbi:MAG: ergothioneine biosynthesis protein EgtB [Betaproteobacteria bacterium]|nr:ergothioneine biosynthesis protein EgtB [Betaproteobacteria bacterium]
MQEFSHQLLESRRRTLLLTQDLAVGQLSGPRLPIVNPFLWELGHVAWFQERWCLRQGDDLSQRLTPGANLGPSLIDGADALYDSSRVPHDTRWDLPLPNLRATLDYQERVLERVLQRLEREAGNESLAYCAELSTYHEDMHAEAFHYMRQTLRYPEPALGARASIDSVCASAEGDAAVGGGIFRLGAEPGTGFVFDNEKWAHEVDVPAFQISRRPVSNEEFAQFADEGGYERREFWSDDGWAWKEKSLANSPHYWAKQDGLWLERRFDRLRPLIPDLPVMHVNWHEAQAYCRYAKRRLPTEAEWELAACNLGRVKPRFPWGDSPPAATQANLGTGGRVPAGALPDSDSAIGCRQMIGNVWEWTESVFQPYPGFVCDPYQDYSLPWFGTHRVLRGGSFATAARLIRNTWRNFFTPDRNDIFAGFRTCALNRA